MYNGSQLTQMTVGNDTLHFVYDATGAPVIVVWNGVAYYYVTTLQGDVFMIMDEDGAILASYDYDAWGNVVDVGGSMASTLGTLNPLRYRGYVYDQETGLYYLQSRYYNPEIGRFINADALVSTGQGLLGNNMFGYCSNNPATYLDASGHAWHTFDERLYGINSMSGIVDSGGGGGGVGAWKPAGWSPLHTANIDDFTLHWEFGIDTDPDETRLYDEDILVGNISLFKTGLGTISSIDVNFTALSGAWKWENVHLGLTNMLSANANVSLKGGQIAVMGRLTLWDPAVSFRIGDTKVTITGHIMNLGGGFSFDSANKSISIVPGFIGLSITLDKWE